MSFVACSTACTRTLATFSGSSGVDKSKWAVLTGNSRLYRLPNCIRFRCPAPKPPQNRLGETISHARVPRLRLRTLFNTSTIAPHRPHTPPLFPHKGTDNICCRNRIPTTHSVLQYYSTHLLFPFFLVQTAQKSSCQESFLRSSEQRWANITNAVSSLSIWHRIMDRSQTHSTIHPFRTLD